MYQISKHSNNRRNTVTTEIFPNDENHPLYPDFKSWLQYGGTPEIVPYFEGEENVKNQKRAIEIDFEYTGLIFEVEKKSLGKIIRGELLEYPQIVLDEIVRLRNECNSKITSETGITDYSYRQSNPKLATINL